MKRKPDPNIIPITQPPGSFKPKTLTSPTTDLVQRPRTPGKPGRPIGARSLRNRDPNAVILKSEIPRWAVPLASPARYKAAHGGRGSGKSHFFAEQLVRAHVQNPNTLSVCVREVQSSLNQSVKRLIEYKIERMGVASHFVIQEAVIKSRRGSGLILFQGMQNHTADSIKSLEGYDRAWVEEAQSLSQRSLDLLRPTIRRPDSEIWFTWNPENETDAVELLLRCDHPPKNSTVVEINFADNPWFPDVLEEEKDYDKRRDPDKYAHVWCGGYRRNKHARVFHNWTVEEFVAPPGVIHRHGADWGFSVDPTVLVRCHIIGRKLYIDYEAYKIGCEITETPALFMGIPESNCWPIIADSARPETISYVRKNGYPKIHAAAKGAGSIEDGIEWLKSFDMVVHPRCEHVIDELTNYSWKVDKQTGEILPILVDKKNHVIDALRYACEGVRRAKSAERTCKPIDVPVVNYFTNSNRWN